MDSLPPELQNYILRELDLEELARCSRVSRRLRESAHRVLAAITSVFHKNDLLEPNSHYDKEFPLALRNSASQYTVSEFTKRGSGSFLRFIAKYCPNVSSLIATHLSVELEDIAALAPRLTYFSLHDIKSSDSLISAKSLAINFLNLQFYTLIDDHLCPIEVIHEYSLIPSSQFARYQHFCRIHNTWGHRSVDVRSIESLQSITADHPIDLRDLRPSSFNCVKYLKLTGLTLSGERLPPLPNLLFANLLCGQSLNHGIRALHNSPRLSFVHLCGKVDDQCVPAIQLLISKCRALHTFSLRGSMRYEKNIDGGDALETLDLSQAKCPKIFSWSYIVLPVEVILPSQFRTINISRRSITFLMDDSRFTFNSSTVFFSKTSTCAHPVDIWLLRGEKLIDRVIHLCPQVKLHLIKLDSNDEETYSLNDLEKMIEKADVGSIDFIGKHFICANLRAINTNYK